MIFHGQKNGQLANVVVAGVYTRMQQSEKPNEIESIPSMRWAQQRERENKQ